MTRGALLFDIDGTMADTDPIHLQAFNRVLGEFGHSFDHHRYGRELQGFANRAIAERFLPDLDPAAQADVMARKEATFRELVRSEIRPMPGLNELLDAADAAGVPVVAVTNAPRANAELLLDGIGLMHRFVALVIGEELAHGKPHPLPYLEGLRHTAADPALSLAFEDSRSGIQSATAAGIATIGIRSGLTHADLVAAGAITSAADFADPVLLALVSDRLGIRV